MPYKRISSSRVVPNATTRGDLSLVRACFPLNVLYATVVTSQLLSAKVQALWEIQTFQDHYCIKFHIDAINVDRYWDKF